jgi:hypothetical protein
MATASVRRTRVAGGVCRETDTNQRLRWLRPRSGPSRSSAPSALDGIRDATVQAGETQIDVRVTVEPGGATFRPTSARAVAALGD